MERLRFLRLNSELTQATFALAHRCAPRRMRGIGGKKSALISFRFDVLVNVEKKEEKPISEYRNEFSELSSLLQAIGTDEMERNPVHESLQKKRRQPTFFSTRVGGSPRIRLKKQGSMKRFREKSDALGDKTFNEFVKACRYVRFGDGVYVL